MDEAFVVYTESALDGVYEVSSFASDEEARAEVFWLREEARERGHYVSYDVRPRAEFEAYEAEEYELAFG